MIRAFLSPLRSLGIDLFSSIFSQSPDRKINLSPIHIAAILGVLPGLHASAATPPVEAFGMRPHIDHVLLSPTGTHYAGLQWAKGKPHLAIYDLADDSDERVKFLELEVDKSIVERVRTIHWLNDQTVGVVVEFESYRQAVPTRETRLFVIKSDISHGRWIPESDETTRTSQFQHRIIDYLPEDPDHILMAIDPFGRGTALNAVRVNLDTGRVRTMVPGGEAVAGYGVDQQGRVRLRHEINDKKKLLFVRDLESRRWSRFQMAERNEAFELRPLAFAEDGQVLLVFKQNSLGFDEIFEVDTKSGKLGNKVLGLPKIDLLGIEVDRYTRKVLGASYAEHHPAMHYFDEQLAEIQLLIDEALPETQNSIENFDRDRKLFVILATGPRVPGTYYLLKKESLQLSRIGDRYESRLEPEQLHDVEPVSYVARDGLTIPAYLTRPEGSGPQPMVVLPHGGPTSRDYQGFDPIAQFLASRGLAVLQPNFRGSSGYGAAFQRLGYGEWGLTMQDDVTDGVKAMIERGIADPERICIVGWSYGGYAALMGAVKTPDLYRCAVSGAGVTDIRRMLSENAHYKFGLKNRPSVGDYRKDRDRLRDTSPINNVDAIKVPILLVHGDKDLSVPIGHSKKMAAKLKKLGKPHRMVVLKDGNHNLSLEQNRVQFLRELELFLAEQLGGGEP